MEVQANVKHVPMSAQKVRRVIDLVRGLNVGEALNIPPSQHVEIQAAFQRHTDNAVSKTINFPSHISVQSMKETLMLAFELGSKGVTIYRDKSRADQVVRCDIGKAC